jgi:hypothetical protein
MVFEIYSVFTLKKMKESLRVPENKMLWGIFKFRREEWRKDWRNKHNKGVSKLSISAIYYLDDQTKEGEI